MKIFRRVFLTFLFDIVSESLPQSQRRSYNSSDWDNSTTPFSSNWTRPPGTWSRWSSHSLPTATHPDKPSLSLSTREAAVKSKEEDSQLLTTPSLKENSVNTELPVLRTSSTRLSPADQNSRKPTTSCGHSNFLPHSVDLRSKDTHSPKVSVPSETEKSSSTPSSRRWSEMVDFESWTDLQTTNEEMLIETISIYIDWLLRKLAALVFSKVTVFQPSKLTILSI